MISNACNSADLARMAELARDITDVCSKAAKGSISDDEAEQRLQKIMGGSSFRSLSSPFLDLLEMVDAVLCSMQVDTESRRRMSGLLKKCADGVLPEDVVKVNIESFTEDASINTRFVKMKTKLFFKQLKFNLFREESEGYAKLITELSQYDGDVSPAETLNRLRCLIGQFNLDPNRALDIILECFESALDSIPSTSDVAQSNVVSFYIDLLKTYHPNLDDLCHIVGFKFTFYTTRRAEAVAVSAPASLYTLAAVLISNGMIDIAELCSYLSPKVEPILAEHKVALEAANARCKTLSLSSLGPDWEPGEMSPGETDNGDQMPSSNQKVGLVQALLRLNSWKEAKYILDRLPEFYAVRHPGVATFLCRMIDRMIEGFYKKFCSQYCIAVDSSSESMDEDGLTLSSFVQSVLPVVAYLGPHLSVDPVLMAKLIRLCTTANTQVSSNPDQSDIDVVLITDICEDVFLPSLYRLRSNCPLAEELWTLLGQFPYTTRFRMYGRLKGEHEKRHPALIIAKGETIGRARYIMKRVSKETTKITGRQLGKLSHSCAMTVFDYILNQIQQFENLIGPVVDSLKYLTNLSYDTLAFCIIEQLASPEKQKLKVSDATLSPWLQSLATFVGSVCKKYNMELTGILQYVANQLKSGKSFDLLVLREIIENMSGVETTTGLTQDQLEALTGGDTLRSEAGSFGQVRNTKRSVNRLKDALMQEDLVISLCILMAQQRGCIVFNEGAQLHLKLTGQMLDQCQETLVQFGSFLATSLKTEDYVKRMPSAPELISAYHLSPDTAMFLARPAYSYKILAKYEELKKADRSNKVNLTPEKKLQHYKTAADFVLGALTKEVTTVFPANTWADMGPRLFCSFWALSMYDLNVPAAAYEREIERVRKQSQQADDLREISDAKKRKEKERCQQLENKLVDEQRRQQEHVERVMARLMDERQEWLPSKAARNASIAQFLQLCLLPRICFSDVDALYSAKFIHTLHRLRTPNFSTLICYDRIFCDIAPIVFSLSENEANHYGRFLCAALETVMHWNRDQETFDKECKNFPGFITRFRNATTDDSAKDVVDFENFRHVVHKWHFKLTKTFLMTLASGSYVPVRNSLLVLIKILPQYPAVKQFSQAIEKKVVQIRDEEKEKRQDLHVLAASYWGHLKVRKAPTQMESDYHKEKEKQKNSTTATKERATASATTEKASGGFGSGASSGGGSGKAAAQSVTTGEGKTKAENGRASTPSSPTKNASTAGSKVTLRKETKPNVATTTQPAQTGKKNGPSQSVDTAANSDQTTAGKRAADSSTVDKKSKQQTQKPTPSSPTPNPSVNGSGTRSSTVQQNADGEPKVKRSRKVVDTSAVVDGTGHSIDGASAAGKSEQSAAVDDASKRPTTKKAADRTEEAEPRSKRRKVEDQKLHSGKASATSSPASSSQRREGSTERRQQASTPHGLDKESKERERDRLPRNASHASLVTDRHEKKTQEAVKREKSQQPAAPSPSSRKKEDDGKVAQSHDRGGSIATSSDRRKVRVSTSSSRQAISATGGSDKPKHGGTGHSSGKAREDERKSRSRKD